jgi:hypothetical protein
MTLTMTMTVTLTLTMTMTLTVTLTLTMTMTLTVTLTLTLTLIQLSQQELSFCEPGQRVRENNRVHQRRPIDDYLRMIWKRFNLIEFSRL